MKKVILFMLCVAMMVGCRSTQRIALGSVSKVDSVAVRDTVRLVNWQRDSVYVNRSLTRDYKVGRIGTLNGVGRIGTLNGVGRIDTVCSLRVDTVVVNSNHIEYRDRIRHDTVRMAIRDVEIRNDTIRVPYEVVVKQRPTMGETLRAALWMVLAGLALLVLLYFLAKKVLIPKLV